MSSPTDAQKIIETLMKENQLWKSKVDDLSNRVILLEMKLNQFESMKIKPIQVQTPQGIISSVVFQ